MIATRLTWSGGTTDTTRPQRLACQWAWTGTPVTLAKGDPRSALLDCSEPSARGGFERVWGKPGPRRATRCPEAPDLIRLCAPATVEPCAALPPPVTPPRLRGLKVIAFDRTGSVADTLRDVLVREFSHTNGGSS